MDRAAVGRGERPLVERPRPEHVEDDEAIVHLGTVLRILMYAGLAIILLGTALGLAREHRLPLPVTSFGSLPSALAHGDTGAILSLGVLLFLFSPSVSLAYLTVSFLRARDRLYTIFAAAVLGILIGSIVVAWFSGASEATNPPALTIEREVVVFVVALVGGILGSMLGLGGGVFITPVLTGFVGIPIKVAIAASAVSVIVNSIGGSSIYLQHKMTNVRLAVFMELTTALGAIAGGFIVVYIAGNILRVIFGIALLAMGITMFRRQQQQAPVTSGPDPLRLQQNFHDPADNADVFYIPQHTYGGAAASSVAGVISGMLGIGGGAVKVPIMNALMRIPVKASAATSVLMVGITVSASAFIYYIHDLIDLSVAIPAMLGVLAGSQAGARVSRRLKNATLVRVLVLILIYLALNLLLQAAGIHLPGTSSK